MSAAGQQGKDDTGVKGKAKDAIQSLPCFFVLSHFWWPFFFFFLGAEPETKDDKSGESGQEGCEYGAKYVFEVH